MVWVWEGEVNGGTYETPLKRPAHHLHKKATPAGPAEYSGIGGGGCFFRSIVNFRFFFFNGCRSSMLICENGKNEFFVESSNQYLCSG